MAGEQSRAKVIVLGVPVQQAHAWVAGVLLSCLCSPDTSFAAHMSGVVAGVTYVYVLKPGGQGAIQLLPEVIECVTCCLLLIFYCCLLLGLLMLLCLRPSCMAIGGRKGS